MPQQVTDKLHDYYSLLYQQIVRHYGGDLQAFDPSRIQDQLEEQTLVPPTPLPPPPPTPSEAPSGLVESAVGWAKDHPVAAVTGLAAASVGLGLAYARAHPSQARSLATKAVGRRAPVRRPARVRNGIRREAVVVLGADTPLGRALVINLTSQGLIVIAAVSSATSLKTFDNHLLPSSRGYVAVRHFDLASLPGSVDSVVAEVKSALSLRFPLNALGDPFARPGDGAILIGILNVLSYVPATESGGPDAAAAPARAGAHLQQALSAHVTAPISVISALLPELRVGAPRLLAQSPEYLTPLTVLTLVDQGASDAENGSIARLVTESATSAASALRESIPDATGSQSSAAGHVSRTLRFTVLSVPPVPVKATTARRDAVSARVASTVADLVLASEPHHPLPPVTGVPLPTPSVGIVLVPLQRILLQTYRTLFSLLPPAATEWLETLYHAVSNLSYKAKVSLPGAVGHRRRPHGSHDGPRRTLTSATVTKRERDQAPERSVYSLRGSTPRPPQSTSGGSAELDAPSSLETGSSADDDDVLRSAPSSAFDEEESRAEHSPWLGGHTAPSNDSTLASSVHTGSASWGQGSTPAASQQWGSPGSEGPSLDQSWVQLSGSVLQDSRQWQ